MAKLTLNDLASGYGLPARYNENNSRLEEALENTLSRDGTAPNEMEADLDLNGNRILNLPDAVNSDEPVTLGQVGSLLFAGEDIATQDDVAALLNPQSSQELAAGVTPLNLEYRHGEANRYSTLADALAASKSPNYRLKLQDDSYAITAALLVDAPVIIEGVGINTSCDEGSIISNITNDVIAINVDDGADLAQRVILKDFGIHHLAATQPAIRFIDGAAYGLVDNVVIQCDSTGHTGVLFGDALAASVGEAWQGMAHNVRVDDFTAYGIRVNTTGHTLELRNCSPRSSVAGARAAYINSRNVHIYGGQYGATGAGGIGIYFHNIDSQAHSRGSVNDVVFESIAVGEYAIVIDGTTHGFNKINIRRVGIQLSTSQGTLVKFGRTSDSVLEFPTILSPTGGGILCEWGEFSSDCKLICDWDSARAAITVHASATRAVKEVYGKVPHANVSSITTDANLTTILKDGVVELPPGFVPVHSNGAWNYWLQTLADDAAASFTLPKVGAALVRAKIEVWCDGGITFAGTAFVDADSGGAAISAQGVGADFNTTTGALAGTTGTDVKVTLSAHTDGKIYLENRSGASRDFTVLITPIIFGT